MNALIAKTIDSLLEKIISDNDRWIMGWRNGMPVNASTGHHYRGMNTLFLWAAMSAAGGARPVLRLRLSRTPRLYDLLKGARHA